MRTAGCFLLLCLLLSMSCLAADVHSAQAEALDTEGLEAALPEAAADILGGMSVTDALEPEGALQHSGRRIRSSDSSQRRSCSIIKATESGVSDACLGYGG